MHKILVIRLYFLLDALHVSDYISPSPGATFYELYNVFGIFRYMPMPDVLAYTGKYQIRCTAHKKLLLVMD